MCAHQGGGPGPQCQLCQRFVFGQRPHHSGSGQAPRAPELPGVWPPVPVGPGHQWAPQLSRPLA
eukprot:3861256-Alexandrium_andersonii.AAC.1